MSRRIIGSCLLAFSVVFWSTCRSPLNEAIAPAVEISVQISLDAIFLPATRMVPADDPASRFLLPETTAVHLSVRKSSDNSSLVSQSIALTSSVNPDTGQISLQGTSRTIQLPKNTPLVFLAETRNGSTVLASAAATATFSDIPAEPLLLQLMPTSSNPALLPAQFSLSSPTSIDLPTRSSRIGRFTLPSSSLSHSSGAPVFIRLALGSLAPGNLHLELRRPDGSAQSAVSVDTATAGFADLSFAPTQSGMHYLILFNNTDTPHTINVEQFSFAGSGDKAILDFRFATPPALGIISGTNIEVIVPFGTNLSALVPAVQHNGASISPASGAVQNFAAAVPYTVTALDGSTTTYTVSVLPGLSPHKDILSFEFTTPPASGTISGTAIAVTVPFGTNVTNLVPTITLSPLATVSPLGGTAADFTSPVAYTVTAEDGTTKAYTVTVTVQAANLPNAPSGLVSSLGAAGVQLTWADNADNETGFRVYRDGSLLISLPTPNLNGYEDTSAAAGTFYEYQVVAYNVDGESSVSNTTAITYMPPTLSLSYPANSAPGIRLKPHFDWNALMGAVNYDLYLSANQVDVLNLEPSALAASNLPGIGYAQPTNLALNQTYYWRLIARNDQGHTRQSPIFSFSTRGSTQYVKPLAQGGSDGNEGSSPASPLQSISEAVNRAIANDTILVMQGEFLEVVAVGLPLSITGSLDSSFANPSVTTTPTILRAPVTGAASTTLTVVPGGSLNLQHMLVENQNSSGDYAVDAMQVQDGATATLEWVHLRSGKGVNSSFTGSSSTGLVLSGTANVAINGNTDFIMGDSAVYPYLSRGLFTTDTFRGTLSINGTNNRFLPFNPTLTLPSAREYRPVELLGHPSFTSTVAISGSDFLLGTFNAGVVSYVIRMNAPQMDFSLVGNTIREAMNGTGANYGVYVESSYALRIENNTFAWDGFNGVDYTGQRDSAGTQVVIGINGTGHQSTPAIIRNRIALGPNSEASYAYGIHTFGIKANIASNVIYRTSQGPVTDNNTHYVTAIMVGANGTAWQTQVIGNTVVLDRSLGAILIQYAGGGGANTKGYLANNIFYSLTTGIGQIDFQNFAPTANDTVHNNLFSQYTTVVMPSVDVSVINNLNSLAWASSNYYEASPVILGRADWFALSGSSSLTLREGGAGGPPGNPTDYLIDPVLNQANNGTLRTAPVSIGAFEY